MLQLPKRAMSGLGEATERYPAAGSTRIYPSNRFGPSTGSPDTAAPLSLHWQRPAGLGSIPTLPAAPP